MRMSELSAETGVSVATLKYYLREGLLPPGEALSATRADYAPEHVSRVRLIRALIDAAGLSIASVRKVVDTLDHPPASRHELLGIAQHTIPGPHLGEAVSDEVHALVSDLGWQISPDAPALHSLSGAIRAARSAGLPLAPRSLRAYARACGSVAEVDVANVSGAAPEQALTTVIVGNVLTDPVLTALRRLAQEDLSSRQR
jgi:DNA-binding transcriptional MerR regulator